MNGDVLDRLIIDHALGVLEPDVEALLIDYVSKHADMRSRSFLTQEVVPLTKEMLRADGSAGAHVFQEPKRRRAVLGRVFLIPAVGAAAALLIVFAGMQDEPERSPVKDKQSVAAVVPNVEPSPRLGIWSTAERWETSRPRRSSRLKWTSPVRPPQLINQGE